MRRTGQARQEALKRIASRRKLVNQVTRGIVATGGAAVIAAISLIFGYLLWVVWPLFTSGSIGEPTAIETSIATLPPAATPNSETNPTRAHFGIHQNNASAWLVSGDQIEEKDLQTGITTPIYSLGYEVLAAGAVDTSTTLIYVLGVDRQLRFYAISQSATNATRLTVRPAFAGSVIDVKQDQTIDLVDIQLRDNVLTTILANQKNLFVLQHADVALRRVLPQPEIVEWPHNLTDRIVHVSSDASHRMIHAVSTAGIVHTYSLVNSDVVMPVLKGTLLPEGLPTEETEQLTAVTVASGRNALVASSTATEIGKGLVRQWNLVTTSSATQLIPVRQWDFEHAVPILVPGRQLKHLAVIDAGGGLHLLHQTSGLLVSQPTELDANQIELTMARDGSRLLIRTLSEAWSVVDVESRHPDVSLHNLWQPVWYEGYAEPTLTWQSSAAELSEPKYSLTPLLFGTLKSAFFALLIATPLALLGALYTACFMSPALRDWVKPGVEVMAALPTVILGFIGGLWLAPIVEKNLAGTLLCFLLLPMFLWWTGLLLKRLPRQTRDELHNWHLLLCFPVIASAIYVSFWCGPMIENLAFTGDLGAWMSDELGIHYEQRNTLIVSIVMGLAVVPVIFSIAEDAIHGVPAHLSQGALALGATPWQVVISVVLVTASPGLFSAVIIGMGRAVGETMIVLMATGNTPIMDLNLFEGLRSFATNIAVELPESEVNSSHYRVLFLCALVLFLLTFVLNTLAELVRHRLRVRYGNL